MKTKELFKEGEMRSEFAANRELAKDAPKNPMADRAARYAKFARERKAKEKQRKSSFLGYLTGRR